jgi:beta-lactamase regulating signal transducer with metallopeptidase domain
MLEWLIPHTLLVLGLAVLVLALGRLLRRAPAVRHVLWLVVLLKFLTPPLLHWPWSLPLPTPSPAPPTAVPDTVAKRPSNEARRMIIDLPPEDWPVAEPEVALAEAPPAPDSVEPMPSTPDWSALALLLWLAGGIAVGAVHVSRLVRLRRLLRAGHTAPSWLEREVGELAAALGVRPPRLVALPGLGSPLIWGCGAPRLLWPRGLEKRLPAEGRRAVLVHELAHLRRRDHWVGWLLLAGGCVWWWHPLYGLVRRRLASEAECACDAWVVATLPGARRAFAEALLEVCAIRSPAPPTAPVLGVAGGRRDLERRLVMVMRERVASRPSRRALLGVGVLALLALPAWSLSRGDTAPAVKTAGPANPAAAAQPAAAPRNAAAATATTVVLPLSAAQPAQDPTAAKPATDQEKKLRDLEDRIKLLTKELHDLRAAAAKSGRHASKDTKSKPKPNTLFGQPKDNLPGGTSAAPKDPYRRALGEYYKAVGAPKTAGFFAGVASADKPAEVILTRTTYKLPAGKAAAVGKFLGEHVKTSVMETKVDGDNLIVTTTPDVQRFIGTFVLLIHGKKPPAGAMYPSYQAPLWGLSPKQ